MTIDDIVLSLISQNRENYDSIVDKVSSNLCYIGFSDNSNSYTTISHTILKVYRVGNFYKVNTVKSGIWNNRASYFGAEEMQNEYSISFNGVNEHLNGGNVHNFERTQAFSVSFWIKPQNLSATRYIISKVTNDAATDGYRIGHSSDGRIILQIRPNGQAAGVLTFNTFLQAQEWSHITVTYTGNSNLNGFRVYVNGFPDSYIHGSVNLINSLVNLGDFTVGCSKLANFFVGHIDEVSLWNKTLSASEVSELYNSGLPSDLLEHSSNQNLLSWYRMGDGDTYPIILDNKGAINLNMINMLSANITDGAA